MRSLTDHPLWGLVDVYAATIPSLQFEPSAHVNYAKTVLPMEDGPPKPKDFPAEMAGSGVFMMADKHLAAIGPAAPS